MPPAPFPKASLGSEPTHQVMAATVACPARVDRAAHIAIPSKSQLAGAPALERLGAEGLLSPGAPKTFSSMPQLERPAQTQRFLPAPLSESG